MIAQICGREKRCVVLGLVALGFLSSPTMVSAQLRGPRGTSAPAQAPAPDPKVRIAKEQPRLVEAAIPVNPGDPIAIVNGEVITRQQVADETIARHGKEILDILIARRLIDQELKKRKLEITNAEIDAEIDSVAHRMAGIGREAWLRTLDKERGISPLQYSRDIIYPTIALRKLATPRVVVTDEDMKDAYEANFGARLYARIITADREREAIEIWEELKKNPGGFETLAKEKSKDSATRGLGGLLSEPIARHAFPRPVSDSAFLQLVDGDPNDKDPAHKPKDGDISGVIQVNQGSWVIIRRERLEPDRPYDTKDQVLRAQLNGQMFDAKIKDEMTKVFNLLMTDAEIDNRLSGKVQMAREQSDQGFQDARAAADRELKRAGGPASANAPGGRAVGAPTPGRMSAAPVGVPADVANSAERLRQPSGKPQ
jgi:parvulin-like peptidyl-prolyl isomerase